MELIFNEISLNPSAPDVHSANLLVEKLIKTYAKAQKVGFKKIRFHKVWEEIALFDKYTFSEWLKSTNNRLYKELLLSAKIYPFIDEKDERAETEYLSRRYFFENEFIEKMEPQGLASAIIYETLAISLSSHGYWQKNELPVYVTDETLPEVVFCKNVTNICEENSLQSEIILDYIGKIIQPVPIATTLAPEDKRIHLRDDHGKDKLESFGKKLLKSEFVISVINSLPFNPKSTNFIHKTYADGKIEIVLYWDDKGIGLIVQTTGRNIHETKAIAKHLQEEFDT